MILVEHHQFIEGRAIERETLLAKEIKNIYCQVQKVKASHIISLAQMNGFLAANTLEMPLCRRIQASGKSLLVQKCNPVKIFIKSSKLACGIQPTFQLNNQTFTIGLDGYSIHKLNEKACIWGNGIINLNDKTFSWKNNSWEEIKTNFWSDNIEIINQFNETIDNEFQYMIVDHPSNKIENFEQLNLLNEVLSEMFSNNEDGIIDDHKESKNRVNYLKEWVKSIIASTSLLILLIVIVLIICMNPAIILYPLHKLNTLCCFKRVPPTISHPLSVSPITPESVNQGDSMGHYRPIPGQEPNEDRQPTDTFADTEI